VVAQANGGSNFNITTISAHEKIMANTSMTVKTQEAMLE
jgi:hypothetical protein